VREGLETLDLFKDSEFLIEQQNVEFDNQKPSTRSVEIISLQQKEVSISTDQKGVSFEIGEWQVKAGNFYFSKHIDLHLDSVPSFKSSIVKIQDNLTKDIRSVSIELSKDEEVKVEDDTDIW